MEGKGEGLCGEEAVTHCDNTPFLLALCTSTRIFAKAASALSAMRDTTCRSSKKSKKVKRSKSKQMNEAKVSKSKQMGAEKGTQVGR